MHVPGSPLGEYRTRWKFTYSVHKECWLYLTCIFTTSSKEKKTGFEQLLLPPRNLLIFLPRTHLPNDLAAVLKKIKKREIRRQPQNYIAMFSTRYYHLLACIYAVLAHDKEHILKLRTLALFLKRN